MTPSPAPDGGTVDGTEATLSVRLHRVRLASVAPLRTARGVIADREVIVVEVADAGGAVGWGECSALARPGYTPEYLDGCWQVLRDHLVPATVADPVGALEFLAGVPGHSQARSALAGALVDLTLRAEGRSLATALAAGAPTAERVESRAVIGLHPDPGDLEAAVAAALAASHRSIKLKIDPSGGVAAVRTVRAQWPELPLAVDANGSFADADQAVEGIAALVAEAGDLAYVEQPLPADDLVGAAVVARTSPVPIALDESVSSLGQAVTAVSLGALGVLNLKPARVGGPLAAMAIAQVMVAEGVPVFCGGMVEAGIGRAGALAFAAQPVCTLPTDLGPTSRYHRRDITRAFELIDGAIPVPDGPGIGVTPDADALAEATVATWHHP